MKALARDLQMVVGVECVDEDEVPTVKGIRARKDNYLEALEHYRPQRVLSAGKTSRALTNKDIEHAIAFTPHRVRVNAGGIEETADSQIIVMTASVPRLPR